jgi:putative ABC transport system permease protein
VLGHYLTIALRSLGRSPLLALINVATLALGLVAFVAAYAVVGFWNRSEQHFANADRTYAITAKLALRDGSISTGTMPQTNELYAKYLRVELPEIEAIAKANLWSREASVTAEGRGARVVAVAADPEFLDIFDLPFVAGDPKTALREPNGLLVTKAAAQKLFGSSDVLGKTVTLGGNLIDATVSGVIGPIPEPSHLAAGPAAAMPFEIMAPYDLYERLRSAVNRPASAPAQAAAANGDRTAAAAPAETPAAAQRENWFGGYCCTTYVLLKRGASFSGADLIARLRDFAGRHLTPEQLRFASLEVGAVPVGGLTVTQLDAQLLGGTRGALSITTLLLALGALVLLVACVNYANLATARAARRAREIGLRKAIGARRAQVAAQYLFEAGLLTLGALAVSVAAVALLAPVVHDATGIDMRLVMSSQPSFWGFAAALLVVVTLLGGAYPAFVLARVRPLEALRLGRVRIGPRFASTVLVGAQFAAASLLLIAVIVMYLQNAALKRTGIGTTQDQHLVISNFEPVTHVPHDLLRAELERLPQVKGVTEMTSVPWSDNINLTLFARTPAAGSTTHTAFQNNVGYDFFATLGMPLVAGRVFDRTHNDLQPADDAGSTSTPTHIVIDDALAAQLGFASPQAAVDQTVWLPEGVDDKAVAFDIIGVVASRPLFLRGLGATSNVYRLRGGTGLQSTIVRLAAADVGGGRSAAEAVWRRLAPQAPFTSRFLDDLFNESYEKFGRFNQVFSGLAVVAFAIAVIGLVGMAIQVAGRRRHEIGVRKSVGAHTRQIVALLLRDFSRPVIVANLLAWPLAYVAAQQYLSVFIERIALTPLPFALSLAVVLLIAWAAVGSQSLRAARANPATVLRIE